MGGHVLRPYSEQERGQVSTMYKPKPMHQSLGSMAEYSPAFVLMVPVAVASSKEEYLKSVSKIGLLGNNVIPGVLQQFLAALVREVLH
ncbi:unnamed protein product [Tuber aestivum]|uniref:Uncharacterized protein n=1 Tax=Tuber aestivum TaxID=59557 RepID=A0A292Q1F1_9PEZI|nr:unnamed protein product [Tuber aestivum]